MPKVPQSQLSTWAPRRIKTALESMHRAKSSAISHTPFLTTSKQRTLCRTSLGRSLARAGKVNSTKAAPRPTIENNSKLIISSRWHLRLADLTKSYPSSCKRKSSNSSKMPIVLRKRTWSLRQKWRFLKTNWAGKSALLKSFCSRISIFRTRKGTKESLETRSPQ